MPEMRLTVDANPTRRSADHVADYVRTRPGYPDAAVEYLRTAAEFFPGDGHPRRAAMLEAADRLFDEHAQAGVVTIRYRTEIHLGRIT